MFLNEFTKFNSRITCLDFSYCGYLAQKSDNKKTDNIILHSIFDNDRVVKAKLKNMGLKQEDLDELLRRVSQSEKIFEIDIGNDTSQSMNRISDNLDILFEFFKSNSTTAVVLLENLSVKKTGAENIQKGISGNPFNPLKILSLRNNAITEHASLHISMIVRSGLLSLDLA